MKHTCGGPVFGRKTAGCPRCDELLAGSPPRQLAFAHRRTFDRDTMHTCNDSCRRGFCTANDW